MLKLNMHIACLFTKKYAYVPSEFISSIALHMHNKKLMLLQFSSMQYQNEKKTQQQQHTTVFISCHFALKFMAMTVHYLGLHP